MMEEFDPGTTIMDLDMENIQTPTPADGSLELPQGEPMDWEPMDYDPTSSGSGTIFDGPSLGLDDDAPPRLLQQPVQQAHYVEPAASR